MEQFLGKEEVASSILASGTKLGIIMTDSIEVGDIVHINCNNAMITISTKAEVLHKPCATGDSWQFKDISNNSLLNGNIIYISEGITITKK